MLNLDRCHQTTFKLICIVAILILSGCAAGSGGSLRASDLKENGDHVAMQASADASEAVIQSDAKIIEERLLEYAGDGNYRMDVTLPDQTGGAGRIDIYMDPKLKGGEDLSFISRVFVSGNLRYSLYSTVSDISLLWTACWCSILKKRMVTTERSSVTPDIRCRI